MWINFSAKEPFALKIYVGGVNAVSGVPINESPEAMLKRLKMSDKVKQDYMVLPDQPWLDGIASEDGRIRQFVAMPMGSGFSVEAQVTGEEKIGGLQFEVTPTKRGCPETLTVKCKGGANSCSTGGKEVVLRLRDRNLKDDSTIEDLKMIIREEFDIAVKHQQLQFLPTINGQTGPSLSNDKLTFSEIWIPNSAVEVEDISTRGNGLGTCVPSARKLKKTFGDGNSSSYGFGSVASKSGGAPLLAKASEMSMDYAPSFQAQPMCFGAPPPPMQMAPGSAPQIMAKKSISRGMPFSARRRSSLASVTPEKARPEVKAMSLAPGGLIKQTINPDLYPASTWSTDSSILFNVQLLNSASFFAVTGRAPPATPIDAKTYNNYGYPFFDIWNEELSGIKGEFGGIKSVGMIEEEKAHISATAEKKSFWDTVAGDGKQEEAKEEKEFVGEEKLEFPVIMLDMGSKRTFKPLAVLEEERKRAL